MHQGKSKQLPYILNNVSFKKFSGPHAFPVACALYEASQCSGGLPAYVTNVQETSPAT